MKPDDHTELRRLSGEQESSLEAVLSLANAVPALLDEVEAKDAEISDLTKALTGLTCGGSEFFSRKGERFVADIPACVAWVRRSKEDSHRRTVKAILENKAKDARIERLEKALAFYGDPKDWEDFSNDECAAAFDRNFGTKLGNDRGITARTALQNEETK